MAKKQSDIRAVVMAAMKAKGWTAYRLGKESGIAPSDVGRWLEDTRADHYPHITTKRLEPILASLGIRLTMDK